MNEQELANALAQCLDEMEQYQRPAEKCLERFPQYRHELAPLLATIAQVRAAPRWAVSPEFRAGARQRIVRRIRQQEARRRPWQRWPFLNPAMWPRALALAPVPVRVLVTLAVIVIIGGGTAVAASDSLPKTPLYPVKRALESITLTVTAGDSRAGVLVDILDRRTAELLESAWQQKTDATSDALESYRTMLEQVHMALQQYRPDEPVDIALAVQWQEALARYNAILNGVVSSLPASTQPYVREAIAATEREKSWISSLVGTTPFAPSAQSELTTPSKTSTPGKCIYIVKKGDTLTAIAKRYNTTASRLATVNGIVNSDRILPGQQLSVPCETSPSLDKGPTTAPAEFNVYTYTVQKGDTLTAIANKYNTTVRLLQAANNLPNPDRITMGQELTVPCYAR
jgi:LysM repeat protein